MSLIENVSYIHFGLKHLQKPLNIVACLKPQLAIVAILVLW
jgi:hypothetical protein